ncbi:MAG: glycosyltransferase family 4 protein [Candidatus Omnitrophota bacterium]|nr:glycosyltransferase family 4 protein [Candidatus Omnitrophota bacterium]
MNILIIAKHLQPGGISSYVVSLAKGLRERGHNIFVASSGGMLEGLLKESSIELINLDLDTKSELSPKVLFAIKKLLLIVKEKNIQIIHAQTRVTSIIAYWLSKLSHIPYLTTCHGFFRPHFFRRLFPFWGKKTIAISDAVYAHLLQDFKLKKYSLELIYNGVCVKDASKFSLEEKRKFKDKFGLFCGPFVGCVARLSDVKGHKFLIDAFKIVLKDFPSAVLILVGDGRIKPDLIAQTKELGIEKRVVFIPSQLDTSLVLSLMDVFVMPSIQEGLGLAIMEAMAVGLPIVATDVGGIKNLIKDNESGILVSACDSRALAEAIILLLKDKNMAKALALKAHDFIQREFPLEKMLNKTEALYNSLLNS